MTGVRTSPASANVLGIVLAGGEGKRLWPLTADRAKPAVPFGGNYRLIDFVLSNLINAGMDRICVLTQYKSHSLDRHITTTWRLSQPARAVHHHGACAAAARPPVVHRQRRRDLPEPQPRLRRGARLHRGVRRRPRVPHGPEPDAHGAHRERRGRHRGGHPGAARRGEGVRLHRLRRDRPDHRVPGEAERAAVGARRPRGHVRVDGQLHLHHRRAARGAQGRRR